MYLDEKELFYGLKLLNLFNKDQLSEILKTIQDVIDGVASDIIEDEVLNELKTDSPGGYGGTHGVQIYLEETLDSVWMLYLGDGFYDNYKEVLVNLEVPDNANVCDDPYEVLRDDVREIFERIFKNKLFQKGVSKEAIESIWREF